MLIRLTRVNQDGTAVPAPFDAVWVNPSSIRIADPQSATGTLVEVQSYTDKTLLVAESPADINALEAASIASQQGVNQEAYIRRFQDAMGGAMPDLAALGSRLRDAVTELETTTAVKPGASLVPPAFGDERDEPLSDAV